MSDARFAEDADTERSSDWSPNRSEKRSALRSEHWPASGQRAGFRDREALHGGTAGDDHSLGKQANGRVAQIAEGAWLHFIDPFVLCKSVLEWWTIERITSALLADELGALGVPLARAEQGSIVQRHVAF